MKIKNSEIVHNLYIKFLNREPDKLGFDHYLNLLNQGKLTVTELEDIFKTSDEYKLSHPIELEKNISTKIRMKKEWDQRTKMNPLFVISTDHSDSETDFWNSGIVECNQILDKYGQRFQEIVKNKEPSKMKILEIGCGICRILIPMSRIFGTAIGVDVSTEMIQLGKKHIENIPNCKILENNGIDLSEFTDNYFDFCFSFIVFQHIPDKKIVENYIREVSRVLKSDCLFRFQVRGTIDTKPKEITTWDGVQFTSHDIHKIAKENNFEIIEEGKDTDEYYWLTFKLIK